MKNCAVVGYGSAGKRIERILLENSANVHVVTKQTIPNKKTYANLLECLSENIEIVFICNKTSEHWSTYQSLRKAGFKGIVIIEKPVADNDSAEFLNIKDDACYVYYNLRFHPSIVWLNEELKNQKVISAQFYVGQYLPSWRPGTEYQNSYSAKKEEGGGVLRDLSHELDLGNFLFGELERINCLMGKLSLLDITSDDLVMIQGVTDKKVCMQFSLNYLDRITQRFVIVHTDHYSYKIDLIAGTALRNDELIKFDLLKDHTHNEIISRVLKNKFESICTLKEAFKLQKLIAKCDVTDNWLIRS